MFRGRERGVGPAHVPTVSNGSEAHWRLGTKLAVFEGPQILPTDIDDLLHLNCRIHKLRLKIWPENCTQT